MAGKKLRSFDVECSDLNPNLRLLGFSGLPSLKLCHKLLGKAFYVNLSFKCLPHEPLTLRCGQELRFQHLPEIKVMRHKRLLLGS